MMPFLLYGLRVLVRRWLQPLIARACCRLSKPTKRKSIVVVRRRNSANAVGSELVDILEEKGDDDDDNDNALLASISSGNEKVKVKHATQKVCAWTIHRPCIWRIYSLV